MNISSQPTDLQTHIRQLVSSRRDSYALPRAFYHSSRLYDYEMEQIWRQGWIFAGHTCQIPQAGDFFTFVFESDSLIIIRDDKGQIRALHNVCTHRGTLLTEQQSGHVRALVCPYHQWTFTCEGSLLSCHGMQEGIEKSQLDLAQAHVEVCEGLIFVSFAQTPPAFDPARELMAPCVRPQGLTRAKIAHIVDYEVRANWKLVWENNRECYHCNVNHPQYNKSNFDIYEEFHSPRIQQSLAEALARSDRGLEVDDPSISHRQGGLAPFPDAESSTWYSANRTVLAEGYASESLDGSCVAPLMGSYRDERGGVLRLRTLPNFWSHASCDHAVTTRLLPAGLACTHVRVTWLVHEEAREGIDYDLEKLLPFWRLTSEQDWELCERVQRGVSSTAYRPGPLSLKREYNLDAFLRWYLSQLTNGLTLLC